MRQRSLRAAQIVKQARDWADELTLLEAKTPAEPLPEIWRRLEVKYGIPASCFWSLRYRDLKDIWASLADMLREALEIERARAATRQTIRADINRLVSGER
jgi:hypothetical protein